MSIADKLKTVAENMIYVFHAGKSEGGKIMIERTATEIGESELKDVSAIGDHAFSYFETLCRVGVPSTVQTIGEYAFSDNGALEEAVIDSTVWGDNMKNSTFLFARCTALKHVTLHGCTSFPLFGFYGCSALETLELSDITTMPPLGDVSYFTNVPSSCKVILPDALYGVGNMEANWCDLDVIYLPKSEADSYILRIDYTVWGEIENAGVVVTALLTDGTSVDIRTLTEAYTGEDETVFAAFLLTGCESITVQVNDESEVPVKVIAGEVGEHVAEGSKIFTVSGDMAIERGDYSYAAPLTVSEEVFEKIGDDLTVALVGEAGVGQSESELNKTYFVEAQTGTYTLDKRLYEGDTLSFVFDAVTLGKLIRVTRGITVTDYAGNFTVTMDSMDTSISLVAVEEDAYSDTLYVEKAASATEISFLTETGDTFTLSEAEFETEENDQYNIYKIPTDVHEITITTHASYIHISADNYEGDIGDGSVTFTVDSDIVITSLEG